ncbi:MAG TPA: alpha/beta hydrolase [Gemmatimonadales bacterium]|nr:alpha/beta hydrolase [Gemmatimonadales bacterium]
MPTLKVGARDVVTYDDVGQGPLVVLIHGSPGTSRVWQPVAERLAPRFRVIAPSLPGYGGTTAPPDGARGDNSYAAELIEALVAEVGRPAAFAGYSYGGVVALRTTLGGKIRPGALALFEPVAVPVLAAVGETEAFVASRAVFEDYGATFDAGDRLAVRKMVDYWFGPATFDRMPAPVREYLISNTGPNVRDVRATFRDPPYSIDDLRSLTMPVLVAYGSRSPEIMVKIAQAIASHAPQGSVERIEKANHAMITTHVDALASLIADLAERSA